MTRRELEEAAQYFRKKGFDVRTNPNDFYDHLVVKKEKTGDKWWVHIQQRKP